MTSGDTPAVFLHGDLDLWILQARDLPNMDIVSERLRRCVTVCAPLCRRPSPAADGGNGGGGGDQNRGSHHHGKIITSDPYVTVTVAGAAVARTAVIPNSQFPVWDEHFSLPLAHPADRLELHVKDNDVFGAQLIGVATIPASAFLSASSGDPTDEWIPIVSPTSGKPPKPKSAIRVRVKFAPFHRNPLYQRGAAPIRDTYFPARQGGAVTLYQDAHVPDGALPAVELEGGRVYRQGKCWEDICHAILEAHHLIYIVGWSVFDKVRLVREASRPLPDAGKLTLGELLKYKSQEGVRVCLLVWDDKTSHDKFFVNMVKIFIFYLIKKTVLLLHTCVFTSFCDCWKDDALNDWFESWV